MYAVCLVHLVLCIMVMAYLVIGTPLNLEGVLISPLLQWIYGAFTLGSIVSIICAGVGTLYHVKSHIDIYAWILLVSTLIDIFFFAVFVIYGRGCKTSHNNAHHLSATLSCGLHDGMTLLCLTLLVILKLFALLVVNKCRAHVHSAYNETLIPFIQNHLASLECPKEPATTPDNDTFLMQGAPRSMANFLPSIRSEGTRFDTRQFPTGSMMSSMVPSMGNFGYGAEQEASRLVARI